MDLSDQEVVTNEVPTPDTPATFKIPRVLVDRSQIPQLSTPSNPSLPGVCEYDQSTFEENLINQLEAQLRRHTRCLPHKRHKLSSSRHVDNAKEHDDIATLFSELTPTEREISGVRHTSLNPRPRDLSPLPSDSSDSSAGEEGKRKRKSKLPQPTTDDTTEEAFLVRLQQTEESCEEDELLSEGLSVPGASWGRLLGYQRHGLSWLWSLHRKKSGGILGDEMGLGKTVQVCVFLHSLHHTQLPDEVQHATGEGYNRSNHTFIGLGHTIIICPATLLSQWVLELHQWAHPLRVVMLHSAGDSGMSHRATLRHALRLNSVVVVTSYQMLRIMRKQLLQVHWHYAILDEAHRIRNPDADITQVCKQLRTPHRLALSGCPVQNSLKELWSLVDFVSPGSLGTLPVFLETLAGPITQGGYLSATEEQVQVAYKCACVLRDALKPYLLRRIKQEVDTELKLPKKNERVLFCRPTRLQALMYKRFLKTEGEKRAYRGGTNLFVAICVMRKICNHPDIITQTRVKQDENGEGETAISMTVLDVCEYMREIRSRAVVMPSSDPDGSLSPAPAGSHSLSGKMRVAWELLRAWHAQGHRVLMFSQTRQTLDLLEQMVRDASYVYLRMDGTSSVASRAKLVKRFNEDRSQFVFLLTTRVGGLGLNLTGADRVIIFDPDWNPSTDHQARERAWRIGQDREVSVFRLVTSGTVEEKMYQRQIFKQYLTNRVLKDPRQRRLFTYSDIHELFSFDDAPHSAETPSLLKHSAPPGVLSTPSRPLSPPYPPKSASLGRDSMGTDNWEITQEDLDTVNDEFVYEEEKPVASPEAIPPNRKHRTASRSKKHKPGPLPSTEIDGHQIRGVCTESAYPAPGFSSDPDTQDSLLLRELLDHCSLDQTLRHDLLEDSTERECVLARHSAHQKAEAAARAIKLARERLAQQPVSVPTWTGQRGGVPLLVTPRSECGAEGMSGLPGVFSGRESILNASAAPSSSDLLASIKSRNAQETAGTMDILDRDTEELSSDLRAFVSFQAKYPGQASTDEILTRFSYLPANQTALFKAILKQICHFNKVGGSGLWKLKLQYR